MSYYQGPQDEAHLRNKSNLWFAKENHVKIAKEQANRQYVDPERLGVNPNQFSFVKGPFYADGHKFWINTQLWTAGLDIDADPDPDVFIPLASLTATNPMSIRDAIYARARALGWTG